VNKDSRKPGELSLPQEPQRHLWTHVFFGGPGLRAGWRLFLYVLLVLFVQSVLSQLVGWVWKHSLVDLTPLSLLMARLTGIGAVFGAALVMSFVEGRAFEVYGLPWKGAAGKRLVQGLLWGLAEVAALIALIFAWGGYSFGSLALQPATAVPWGGLWLLVFLAVAFYEDFGFRGYTQFTLASGIGFWPAASLLSALFGAVHLGNPGEGWVGSLSAALIGLFYCLTLRRTGNLWFAVGAHAAFDWGETFLFSVTNSGFVAQQGHLSGASLRGPTWLTGGSVGPEGSIFCFLLIALMFAVFPLVFPAAPREGRATLPGGHETH
jgi:hypothetical protein